MRANSRRFASPVALAAALCAAVLAGCGGGGHRDTRTTAPVSPRVFIDLVAALPAGLDPADDGPGAAELQTSLAATLVRPRAPALSATKLPGPEQVTGYLASGWRRLPGGGYVFALRRGVRSAYGHDLSAADVVFSFRRELARSASARALAALGRISAGDPASALGRSRVRVNVSGASPLTLAVLASFHFGVLDATAVRAHARGGDAGHAWLSRHLASYSPYALTSFAPGRHVFLHALARAWEHVGYDHVAIEAGSPPALRLADVGGAVASHATGLGWDAYADARLTSGLVARVLPSTAVRMLVPDRAFAPFASALVRRAVSLALDRRAISRAAYGGFAPPAAGPLPRSLTLPGGVVAPAYGHDPALARALLRRAGYAHGFSFTLAGAGNAERRAITGELGAIGLRVRAARGGSADARLVTASSPIASPSLWLRRNYGVGAGVDLSRALASVAASLPAIAIVELPAQLVSRLGISGYAAYANGATYYDRLRPS